MLWLKAWMETRWRLVWALCLGGLLFVLPFARGANPQRLVSNVLGSSGVLLSFLVAIMLAGSGIQTASARPGFSEKGGEGSTLFTLSLPVSRTWLFVVRTVTGVLETVVLLTLFAVVVWLLVPPLAANALGALGHFAVIASWSLTVYAISACLSTFLDEGSRIRASGIAVVVLFAFATIGKLPRSIDLFGPLLGTSLLITHQSPWATIVAACVLALLFLAAALTIIQRRNY